MTKLEELDEQIKRFVDKGIAATYIARVLDLKPREVMLIANIRNFYTKIEKDEGQMGLLKIAKIKEDVEKLLNKGIPKKLIHIILDIDERTVKILLDDIKYYKNTQKVEGEQHSNT